MNTSLRLQLTGHLWKALNQLAIVFMLNANTVIQNKDNQLESMLVKKERENTAAYEASILTVQNTSISSSVNNAIVQKSPASCAQCSSRPEVNHQKFTTGGGLALSHSHGL